MYVKLGDTLVDLIIKIIFFKPRKFPYKRDKLGHKLRSIYGKLKIFMYNLCIQVSMHSGFTKKAIQGLVVINLCKLKKEIVTMPTLKSLGSTFDN